MVTSEKRTVLDELRETVGGFLRKSFGEVPRDDEGDLVVGCEGVSTWVRVQPLDEDQTAVLIWSVPVVGMRVDAELTRLLATEAMSLTFGQFELHEDVPRIHVSHALLGEFLSREELEVAVQSVAKASAHYGALVRVFHGGSAPNREAGRPGVGVRDEKDLTLLGERIGRHLRGSFTGVSIDDGGDFAVPFESVITWVRPARWTDGRTVARLWSITNVDVPDDGKLTRFLLTSNADIVFGGFRLDRSVPAVLLVHYLLGEYLNREELVTAVAAVSTQANLYAPKIRARFGGHFFGE